MSDVDAIIRRWRANASVAEIPLTDDDIDRIVASGAIERIKLVEAIVERTNAREVVPDYLSILAGQVEERGNG